MPANRTCPAVLVRTSVVAEVNRLHTDPAVVQRVDEHVRRRLAGYGVEQEVRLEGGPAEVTHRTRTPHERGVGEADGRICASPAARSNDGQSSFSSDVCGKGSGCA
jgi:hypothetical protein